MSALQEAPPSAAAAGPPRRERRLVALALFCITATLSHFIRAAWAVYTSHLPDPASMTAEWSPRYAPDAYRVALPWLTTALARLLHCDDWPTLAAGEDWVFGFAALYVLYLLLARVIATQPDLTQLNPTRTSTTQPAPHRTVAVAFFLACVQLPLNWVVPWQRQETLPTALYLAASLYLLLRAQRRPQWLLAVLACTLLQSFVRTDVPAAFSVALFGVALLAPAPALPARKSLCLRTGAACLAVTLATQLYLSHIRFPHRSYPPGTPVFTARLNLHPHNLETLALAVGPFLLVAFAARWTRVHLHFVEKVLLLASLVEFLLWSAVGGWSEARIFVPFLLAFCVPAARVLTALLLPSAPLTPKS